MSSKVFVANLPWSVTSDDLKTTFSEIGTVVTAKVIMDRESGKSKGFGFVEMASSEEATKAISELNGGEMGGRPIIVKEATPQAPRADRPERSERTFEPRPPRTTNDVGFTKYDSAPDYGNYGGTNNYGGKPNRRERSGNFKKDRRREW